MTGHSTRDPRRGRLPVIVAWGLAGGYAVVFALTLWMDRRLYAAHIPQAGEWWWLGLHGPWLGPFLVFALVGALIVSRRPRNRVGWAMLLSALGAAGGEAIRTFLKLELGGSANFSIPGVLAPYVTSQVVTVAGVMLGVVFVPLLFPDGRLPSFRWRAVVWVAGLTLGLLTIGPVFSPVLTDQIFLPSGEEVVIYEVVNPLARGAAAETVSFLQAVNITDPLIGGLVVAAAAGVVVRFRRSRDIERQQMKWFVFASALVALAVAGIVALQVLTSEFGLPSLGLTALGLSAYPVAVGIAVLRYRLYEIDRIISRTVTYGLVVAVLAAVYVALVVSLGAAVSALFDVPESDLVVALSTLAVAALFRPVQTRVQSMVDRRFNRSSYEARRAVERFTHQVRDEVDLDRIRQRVARTARSAVQPNHVSVWLLSREGKRSS